MVKNVKGGTGHKSMARKNVMTVTKQPAKTRIALDEDEMYAQVTKILGGAMCHVLCHDDVMRLCHIRGKFRGRGKRDNMIGNGKWILVGKRSFESEKTGKLENCDLLEIYSEQDKDKLRSQIDTVNWNLFVLNDCLNSHTDYKTESDILFTDKREEEYENIMLTVSSIKNSNKVAIKMDEEENTEEEEINIDDI